ncbi:hypothetical protein [Frondihabitans australicus]|uniref:Uncharacterized protein n=1 Tax=Frondihabitans australicus TaxID=386892 RepID=A0A495IKM9_9MICO|nr:hypothetical protein [Frondihabitans australicus]RKR76524.1 hypothetical protein C8E83_3701 [Frondihabitans australicus]
MSDSHSLSAVPGAGPADPRTAAARTQATVDRIHDALTDGVRVRIISVQMLAVILGALMGSLSITLSLGSRHVRLVVVDAALVAASVVVGLASWARARREHRLQPQVPRPRSETLWAFLSPDERRRLTRQIRGRESVDAEWRELVRLSIAFSRATNRAAWPTLFSMGLWYCALALVLGWEWFVVLGALVVLLTVGSRIESTRWNRALRSIEADEAASGHGGG